MGQRASAYMVLEQLKPKSPGRVRWHGVRPSTGPGRRSSPPIGRALRTATADSARRGRCSLLLLPAAVSVPSRAIPQAPPAACESSRPRCLVCGRAHAGPGSADGQEWAGSKSNGN